MDRMGRLRRSLRDSFRKKRDSPESSKPHQWQADEEAVKAGNCSFPVKYLGCVEVLESRGMPVCEDAMKMLRQSRRRPVKSILFISGDGLRVVEDDTKGLIVDQTIEKVSFCAPDRNHERGFSYICRDGTTRRWMCHGFLASKDSGERLSHAVGCAFAACLDRKQRREKECGVSMTFDSKTSTFTRSGSFRVNSLTDNLSNKSGSPPLDNVGAIIRAAPPGGVGSAAANPHAIERPHAPVKMLERQGSFRGFSQLSNQSPFKRQLSLRLSDLPSNLQRTQHDDDSGSSYTAVNGSNGVSTSANASPAPPPRTQRNRLHSLPNNSLGGMIPESTTSINGSGNGDTRNLMRLDSKEKDLTVTELCQQVTQEISLLAAYHDDAKNVGMASQFPTKFSNTNPWDDEVSAGSSSSSATFNPSLPLALEKSSNTNRSNFTSQPLTENRNWTQNIPGQFTGRPKTDSSKVWTQPISTSSTSSPSKIPLYSKMEVKKENAPARPAPPTVSSSASVSVAASVLPTSSAVSAVAEASPKVPETARAPLISSGSIQQPSYGLRRPGPARSQSLGGDPFDADWANQAARTGQTPTNPFARQQQTFQISM